MDIQQVLMNQSEQFRKAQDVKYQDVVEVVKRLERRFTTSTIGNLSIIEESLGHLWGHGKKFHDLTEGEKAWRRIWADTREKILNHSNNQMRLAVNELIKTY
jgi:hypothetical protein